DEPDLVKTDGRRIVTVSSGVLQVVDARTRTLTGALGLAEPNTPAAYQPADLLLAGDHALVLLRQGYQGYRGGPVIMDGPESAPGRVPPNDAIAGPRLLLVDLTGGRPRLLSSFTVEGGLIDARQVGSIVRVVVQSAPRIAFPIERGNLTDAQRIAANRAIIDRTDVEAWLPRWNVESGGEHLTGRVDCTAVS